MFTFIKKLFIPHGLYCYTPLKIIPDDMFGFKMKPENVLFINIF